MKLITATRNILLVATVISAVDASTSSAEHLRGADARRLHCWPQCSRGNPCKNGGRCSEVEGACNEFNCDCPWPYYGERCEQTKCPNDSAGLSIAIDQENIEPWRGAAVNIRYVEVGQSFQPSCGDLYAVRVNLKSEGAGIVTAKILRNGETVAKDSSNTSDAKEGGWLWFDIYPTLNVIPGETLVLQLESTSPYPPSWKYNSGGGKLDMYEKGAGRMHGLDTPKDFLFRTYSSCCPRHHDVCDSNPCLGRGDCTTDFVNKGTIMAPRYQCDCDWPYYGVRCEQG